MDKQIVDKLIKFGLITNICVNSDNYTDVDDLINKGIITVPGAKERITKLLKDEIIVEETVEPVIEPVNDTTDIVIVKEDIKETDINPIETVEPAIESVKTEETNVNTKRAKKQNKTE